MILILLALAIIVGSGFLSLLRGKQVRSASWIGVTGVWLGSVLILYAAGSVLFKGGMESWRREITIPGGALSLYLDSLSAFFLFPILILSSLAAWYGTGYLKPSKKNLGVHWFFYNLLVASMVTIVLAHNAILFLMAWEAMTLASFFLVTFDQEKETVREAGWIYLVASHLGTGCLFIFFLLIGAQHDSLEFERSNATANGGIFLLALIGFGTKAGLMPLHVWLPEAHPAAPSHVSALMSGVMIKTGIYGLLRACELCGSLPAWVAWVVLGMGMASGILGILFALSQHNLKRLLAYSSVENMGIIAIGLGLGLLGISHHVPGLAMLGFLACLAHIINHASYKGLLFLCAGATGHATGTLDMNLLGGLLKRMPWTGATFAAGAAAICGLPPFNGFISEFLIFAGAFRAGTTSNGEVAILCLAVIAGLAFIGGLAVAAFAKAFGTTFLGEPRSEYARQGHEVEVSMRWPIVLLASLCLILGITGPLLVPKLFPVVSGLTGYSQEIFQRELGPLMAVLPKITLASLVFFAFFAVCFALRRWLLLGRVVEQNTTWGCGYLRPDARIQYTASSFTQPFGDLFHWVLRTQRWMAAPSGFFPKPTSFRSETPDLCQGHLYHPAFLRLNWGLSKLRWLQHGKVQLYVLYIAAVLMILLVWKLAV
jgi:hydrogenase-4 component B